MKTLESWFPRTIVTWIGGVRVTEYYNSYNLFVSNKNRNNDGKTSYWEKTFPNDGGHRNKLFEFICDSITFLVCIVIGYLVREEQTTAKVLVMLIPCALYLVKSFVFDITFNYYKYGKPN
jgi:hypothetical protein